MSTSATPVFDFDRFRPLLFLTLLALLLLGGGCTLDSEPVTTGEQSEEDLHPEVVQVAPEELEPVPGGARRLILVIGDGMGAEQIRAASLYKTGTEEGLALQSLPVYSEVATHSASHRVTDSAAAGTALATAVKVENGAVGVRLPGDGADLPTITEDLTERGWRVGLVTTAFTTHATPAAFGAHVRSRLDYGGIARDYLTRSRPHVILGGGGYGMDPDNVAEAGYTVVTDRHELSSQMRALTASDRLAGLFGDGHLPYLSDGRPAEMPGLVEMSQRAVEFLAAGDEGFFLMIEGARIDHAGHANDIERLIPEVLELDAVVEMLLNHPLLEDDTLLVVTADHETGGLSVTDGAGEGVIPTVGWSTNGHTAADVPLFAAGVGAEKCGEVVDNTLLNGAMLAALDVRGPDSLIATEASVLSGEEKAQ